MATVVGGHSWSVLEVRDAQCTTFGKPEVHVGFNHVTSYCGHMRQHASVNARRVDKAKEISYDRYEPQVPHLQTAEEPTLSVW
jgi:hypothetical protein